MNQKVHVIHVCDYLQQINMTGRFYHVSNVEIYPLDRGEGSLEDLKSLFFWLVWLFFLVYNEQLDGPEVRLYTSKYTITRATILRGHFCPFSPEHGLDFVNEEATPCKAKFVFIYMYMYQLEG